MKNKLVVFIGYDPREHQFFEVCKKSLVSNSSGTIIVYPLDHRTLRQLGLLRRQMMINSSTGNLIDGPTQLPMATEFSHSRFATRLYAKFLGYDKIPVLFVDCDFVFEDDVFKLLEESNYTQYEVCVVKHNYKSAKNKKMDNQVQIDYSRKLWSSLMLFNMEAPSKLDSWTYVNQTHLADLHTLKWVDDRLIGSLDEKWNFIPDHSEKNVEKYSAIHFTVDNPNLNGYTNCKYGDVYEKWRKEWVKSLL